VHNQTWRIKRARVRPAMRKITE